MRLLFQVADDRIVFIENEGDELVAVERFKQVGVGEVRWTCSKEELISLMELAERFQVRRAREQGL